MADTVVHIGENSPEYVALQLLEKIRQCEGKVFSTQTQKADFAPADREWILDTYAECLRAVRPTPNPQIG